MIEKIERLNVLLVGAGALIGWAIGFIHAPSFLLGGGIMQANFWLLKKVVRAVLSRAEEGNEGKKSWAILWFSAKGVLFLVLLSALFTRYPVHAESFAGGVSLLLVSCVIVSLAHGR